jgi:hypothetical protein
MLTLVLALEIPLALDMITPLVDEEEKRNQSPLLSCCNTAEYILIIQKLIVQADEKITTTFA